MRGSALSRALMWSAMRRFADKGRLFTLADLGEGRAPRRYLDLLIRQGYVRVVDPGVPQAGVRAQYQLVRNPGPSAPVQFRGGCYDPNCAGKIHDPLLRIWSALRRFGWLTLRELSGHAETDLQLTRKYLRCLEKLGYVQVCLGRGGHKGARLVWNTGPAAPIPERGTGRVFDPNLARFVEVDDATA